MSGTDPAESRKTVVVVRGGGKLRILKTLWPEHQGEETLQVAMEKYKHVFIKA